MVSSRTVWYGRVVQTCIIQNETSFGLLLFAALARMSYRLCMYFGAQPQGTGAMSTSCGMPDFMPTALQAGRACRSCVWRDIIMLKRVQGSSIKLA